MEAAEEGSDDRDSEGDQASRDDGVSGIFDLSLFEKKEKEGDLASARE